MTEAREVEIVRLGARGDGVASTTEGPVFVPYALPGESWRVAKDAEAERLTDSPERVPPVCPKFGRCGGCAMQHLEPEAYAAWKRGVVVEALRQHGIAADVDPLVAVPPASRRRAVLTAIVERGACALGYHAARSHELVDLAACPVLAPEIVAAFADLRRLAAIQADGAAPLRLTIVATDTGLDVTMDVGRTPLSPADRIRLSELAEAAGWARLNVGIDPVVERRRPQLLFGAAAVVPPPGVFLQAVRAAEHAIRDAVVAGAGRAKRVADLFCGIGTLSFPLAAKARVLAIDSDPAALAALEEAARQAQGLKPIETRRRDLFIEPLARKELEPFDCVVFDPPRAGASAQAEMLAKSKVPRVIAVSCNPATLARDLEILLAGGYALGCVTPIDQFLFAPHVEVVAVLERPTAGRRR
ncbi:MAG: class I SAM-dependent RNA methyltransferase [Hyphomicrobiaceae bacterium]|nr:class I SAM-dependent RNA methyltransferase [Hyphomicrobiaceae bacterium]